jgi:hypothetical protein
MALVFKEQERADIYARVCGECGYAVFVEDAGSIYQTYVESLPVPLSAAASGAVACITVLA